MLLSTLQHLPQIGPVRERAAWNQGLTSWDAFETARRQKVSDPDDPILLGLKESRQALENQDWGYFLSRLPHRLHWRVLAGRVHQGLYFDIETNGGSLVTVLGAWYQGEFRQWTWPEVPERFFQWVAEAPFVSGYCSRGFDVPVTRAAYPRCPLPRAQIDLVSLTRALGMRGGLKGAEKALGIQRQEDLDGLRGSDAIWLWDRWRNGQDQASLDRLERYNRADVEKLPELATRLLELCYLAETKDLELPALPQEVPLEAPKSPPIPAVSNRIPFLERELHQALSTSPVVVFLNRDFRRFRKGKLITSKTPRCQDALGLAASSGAHLILVGPDFEVPIQEVRARLEGSPWPKLKFSDQPGLDSETWVLRALEALRDQVLGEPSLAGG